MSSQTITFPSATAVNSTEFTLVLSQPGRPTVIHLSPVGCAITACILQIRPVDGAAFEDFIGGGSSVDWTSTTSPRLRDVSSTLPSTIADGGRAWANVDLTGFFSARLVVTSGGAGSATLRTQQ